jgi:sulfite reductase (NADPH) flavoprotein alpha-component
MLKKILFQVHWFLGISAGVVIAIVGVTGAVLSFEHEILEWLNRGVVTVEARSTAPVPVHELLARIQSNNADKKIQNITVASDPQHAPRVTFAPPPPKDAPAAGAPPQRRRGETRYVDPYSGELLGGKQLRGQPTLQTIERVHRGMVAGPTGRMIVGISTFALIFFALSGLYLRWPKSGALKWQTWFKIHGQLKGRAFLWNLHSIVGTWMLPIYLLASLSGLYFSYDWYRQGLIKVFNATPPNREVPKLDTPASGQPNVAQLWAVFEKESGNYDNATLALPQSPDQSVEIRYLRLDAAHERATDRLVLHPETAAVIKHERFVDRDAGTRIIGSMLPLHSGSYFGITGVIVVMLASLAMPLFAITGWMLYLKRRKAKQLAAEKIRALVTSNASASNTTAESVAESA